MDFSLIEARPGITVVLLPDAPMYTVVAVSNDFEKVVGVKRETIVGRGHLDLFPPSTSEVHVSGERDVKASYTHVMEHKEPHHLPLQRYDIPDGRGGFQEKYWRATNVPVLGEDGEVHYIIHAAEDITEQVQAQKTAKAHQALQTAYDQIESNRKELQSAHERITEILESTTDSFYALDADFNFTYVNQRAAKLWGRDRDALLGKHYWTEFNKAVGSKSYQMHYLARNEGSPVHYETVSPLLGTWIEASIYPGTDGGLSVFFRDITDRKKAEEALRLSEERFRVLVSQATVGFVETAEGKITYVNDHFCELTGRKREELIGKTVGSITHPEDVQRDLGLLKGLYESGEPFVVDKRYVRPDGSITWVHNSVAVLRNREGKITGGFAASVDVTDRKRAEEALSQSEERLQKVLSIETVGVIYFDLEGGIHDANVAFERMSGYSKEDLKSGKVRWDEVTPPEFMDVTLKSRQEFLTKRQNTPYEKQYIRADGSRFWGLFAGKRLSETECVEFVVDITESKEAETLLEQRVTERTHELEMRNRELEQFTYVSSHDLQEPLRKIIMFADLVRSDSYDRLTEASQIRLDKVIHAARRMSTVLRNVLDFASLNKEESLKTVYLEEVLGSVYSEMEIMIQEKGARITADTLPVISAIPTQMHQLFYNLLNNALKFSKPGEAPLISINCKKLDQTELSRHAELPQRKEYYQVTVKDNGIGFHTDAAEKIFGMFQRLHNREAYAGTGIGLALVKKVVMNHHGKIWAESHPGEGASFIVVLPAE